MSKTTIRCNYSYKGETIEQKVRRISTNKEPIKDGAPITYTERKDGVLPAYNPRTDRFELAVEAMDGISRQHIARREERAKVVEMTPKTDGGNGGAENTQQPSTGGTDNK